MATNLNKSKNSSFSTAKIFLCLLFLFCGVVGTWGMYYFNNDVDLTKKATSNILGLAGFGFLINFLTNMYFGESKRRDLAETTYDKLYNVVNQLLIKSETEKLNVFEFTLLSQLSDIMAGLSKYCDVNLDIMNNRYERLKNHPPQYIQTISNTAQNVYGSVQAYDEFMVKHQHAPTLANSGSQAVPPMNP
jgi:hypothetical protein